MYRKRVILSTSISVPFLVLLLILVGSTIGRYDYHSTVDEYDDDIDDTYGKSSSLSSNIGLERILFPTANPYARLLESIALDKRSVSGECSQNLLSIADGIRNRKPFAFKCKFLYLFPFLYLFSVIFWCFPSFAVVFSPFCMFFLLFALLCLSILCHRVIFLLRLFHALFTLKEKSCFCHQSKEDWRKKMYFWYLLAPQLFLFLWIFSIFSFYSSGF